MACIICVPNCKTVFNKALLMHRFKVTVWTKSVLRTEANRFQSKSLTHTCLSKSVAHICSTRYGVHRFSCQPTFRCPFRSKTDESLQKNVDTQPNSEPKPWSLLRDKSERVGKQTENKAHDKSRHTANPDYAPPPVVVPNTRKLLHRKLSTYSPTCNMFKLFNRDCKLPMSKSGSALKITVLGAAGNVGEALSLMLKQSPLIDELALYDICNTKGMVLDLSFVDSKCEVLAYTGEDELADALKGARVVVITASAPFKEGLSFETRFGQNAEVVAELTEACIKVCPGALIAVLTSPVNSIMPVVSEIFKAAGNFNPTRVFGITTLDVVHANTYLAKFLRIDPQTVMVPVVGGSSGQTVVPVFTQAYPKTEVSIAEATRMTHLVQEASAEALCGKPCVCLPSMSLAFAAARFVISLCKGCNGHVNVIECAYVSSCEVEDCPYFATPVELGPQGLLRNHGIPALTSYENCLLERAIEIVREDIDRGINFVTRYYPEPPVYEQEKKIPARELAEASKDS